MHRQEAIEILTNKKLNSLSVAERESLLMNYWLIDAGDSAYKELPDALKKILSQYDSPFDAINFLYNPLIKIALKDSYEGVLNSYIEIQLLCFMNDVKVDGPVESLKLCSCCFYHTLKGIGWEICPVCFWEDDGSKELDQVSGANHMTLGEARNNFLLFGAISEAYKDRVLQDGKKRYASGTR
jgi:hypothetical protein